MTLARILAIVLAVTFAHQATGAAELFEPASCCPDPCPSDDDEGRCAPACATCAFAKVFAARLAPRIDAPIALADAPDLIARATGDAREGVRDDVFHPPRA